MLIHYVGDASGNGHTCPFPSFDSQHKGGSYGYGQIALRVSRFIGKTSAFMAACMLVLALALSSATKLSAQTAGSISGHIDDATGAVIPGANVVLKNLGTGTERSTVTTGSGDYTFTDVPVGMYTVTATHQGFKTGSSNNVQVQVQQSIRLDFSLQVGEVTQTVEVSASAALLQAENATLGSVVENKAIN
jgi:hypothetical protein